MQQDDATAGAAAISKPVKARLASSASAGNISVVPATANTTRMLLDASVPVKLGVASSTSGPTAVASAPLSNVIHVSDSSSGQAVPIQLIATSQGIVAIPQNYKLIAQNATMAAQGVQPTVTAVVSSPTKRRLSAPTMTASSLLKVAKVQTPVTASQVTVDSSNSTEQSGPSVVVTNSLPHTVSEAILTDTASVAAIQAAIRDSYEKLFWKVYLQSSSFQSMPRPSVEGLNGSTEVSLEPESNSCHCA